MVDAVAGAFIVPHSSTYFDLLDACREDGCPICRLALAAVRHYLDSMNYDSVNDPGFQQLTEAADGFCNQHAAQWLQQANVLGTAMIYKRVLERLTPALQELAPVHHNGTLLGGLLNHDAGEDGVAPLEPAGACPACLLLADVERLALTTLISSLGETELHDAYLGSAGLCWPHLIIALARTSDAATFVTLRDHALGVQRRLIGQLGEVIRKHDYRFRDEPLGEERGSVQRAVRHVAGEPGVDRLQNKLHGQDVMHRR